MLKQLNITQLSAICFRFFTKYSTSRLSISYNNNIAFNNKNNAPRVRVGSGYAGARESAILSSEYFTTQYPRCVSMFFLNCNKFQFIPSGLCPSALAKNTSDKFDFHIYSVVYQIKVSCPFQSETTTVCVVKLKINRQQTLLQHEMKSHPKIK